MSARRPSDSFDENRPTSLLDQGDGEGGDEAPTARHEDLGVVAELRAVLSRGETRSISLYGLPDQIVVGRGSMCDWQLEDNSLSRRHAILHWSGHSLAVEDLGSANGTRLNGRPLSGTTEVPFGATLFLGTVAVTLAQAAATREANVPPTEILNRDAVLPEPEPPTPPPAPQKARTPAPERRKPAAPPPPPPEAHDSPEWDLPASLPPSALHNAETSLHDMPAERPPAGITAAETRLTAMPETRPVAMGAAPPAAETRITAAPTASTSPPRAAVSAPPPAAAPSPAGPNGARAAVFRPAQHAAGPTETTGEWDPAAVLARPPERVLDARALWEALKTRWRANRRPFVLAGAAVWVGLLVILLSVADRAQPEDEDADAPVARASGPRARGSTKPATPTPDRAPLPVARRAAPAEAPTVTPLDTPPPAAAKPVAARHEEPAVTPAAEAPAPVAEGPDRDALLAQAIAAYDLGKVDDALTAFRRLAALDPKDAGARYMVDLLESQAHAGPDK